MFRKITCKNLTGLENLSGLAREIIFLTNYSCPEKFRAKPGRFFTSDKTFLDE